MKRMIKRRTATCLAAGLVICLAAGCGGKTGDNGKTDVTALLGEGGEKTISYEPEDFEEGWDEQSAGKLVFSDEGIRAEGNGILVSGNQAVITKGGAYVVSGNTQDGQIRIEAGEDELVHLILNQAELSNKTTAPVYSVEKAKVVLTLADGTKNIIEDGNVYQYESSDEDEPDAPVFVKGDLTINGSGRLEIHGNYKCGIHSKDNLKVMDGTIAINADGDGLKGRDSVIIRDGTLDIQAGKDGIKSNHDEDPDKGYIWIDGGQIAIAAGDDGIQAETALIVRGGNINVTESQEGLAGKTVDILGGQVKAVTQDDGINSAASVETEQEKMQDQEGVYTRIAGGQIWLDAMADGIDSNGDLYMEGGELYLSGPVSRGDGILDYNGRARLTGGVVFAAGTSGMMQTFGEDSSQNYLVIYWEESQEAGSVIRLADEEGQALGEYRPEKAFDTAIISVPGLQNGSVYQVLTENGGEEESVIELEANGVETVYGTPAGGMGGRGRAPGALREENGRPERPGRFRGGQMPPEGERPEGSGKGHRLPESEHPEEFKKDQVIPEGKSLEEPQEGTGKES